MTRSISGYATAGFLTLVATTLAGCAASTDLTSNDAISGQEAGPQVTLLVTNATCSGGHCDPLDVRLYPQDQLRTPGGLWNVSIGTVTTAQQCITLPASEVQRVIGPVTQVFTNPDGTTSYGPGEHPDTTIKTWTPGLAASLGANRPGDNAFAGGPSTDAFVPGGSTGWSVTLPGGQPTPGARCR